jgi:hypothetical protein
MDWWWTEVDILESQGKWNCRYTKYATTVRNDLGHVQNNDLFNCVPADVIMKDLG